MLDSIRLNVTTDGSGDGTATATRAVFGTLYAIQLIDGDYADGVDATIAVINADGGVDQTIYTGTDFNTDQMVYPRATVVNTSGTALVYSAGNAVVTELLINGTLKLTIAQGGATKTGGCIVYFKE